MAAVVVGGLFIGLYCWFNNEPVFSFVIELVQQIAEGV